MWRIPAIVIALLIAIRLGLVLKRGDAGALLMRGDAGAEEWLSRDDKPLLYWGIIIAAAALVIWLLYIASTGN